MRPFPGNDNLVWGISAQGKTPQEPHKSHGSSAPNLQRTRTLSALRCILQKHPEEQSFLLAGIAWLFPSNCFSVRFMAILRHGTNHVLPVVLVPGEQRAAACSASHGHTECVQELWLTKSLHPTASYRFISPFLIQMYCSLHFSISLKTCFTIGGEDKWMDA